ncbi:MAG TPA: flagellar basal body rod protein FlgC, partial [Deltaproteobacteria bacterium]|nr:flagellar basal body rod protein FlgC [Deltaproteobacteria bacterium]
MSFLSAFNTSVSGMVAQRQRVNTISENIANAETTRTPQGGPYRRREVVLASVA